MSSQMEVAYPRRLRERALRGPHAGRARHDRHLPPHMSVLRDWAGRRDCGGALRKGQCVAAQPVVLRAAHSPRERQGVSWVTGLWPGEAAAAHWDVAARCSDAELRPTAGWSTDVWATVAWRHEIFSK